MGYGAVGGGTSRKKQGTVTPVHNLACQRLHQILTSSWSNQTLGAIGERGEPLDLIQVQAARSPRCELWPSHVAPAKPPSSGARLSACARVSYSMDGTVRVTALCVRGCALAHVQHKEADGWWALYVCCRLNLVQVAPPYLTGCRSRNKSNTRPIHRFTLAGCPKASHDAAIDGDTDTHVPDNSPPDGPRDGISRRKVPSMCVRLLTDKCTEWQQQHCRSVSWTGPVRTQGRFSVCVCMYKSTVRICFCAYNTIMPRQG